MGFWELMRPAALAAIVMAPIHCLFGLHIVRRGVIFIDLAVAQVAALGVAVGVLLHFEAGSAGSYWLALGFALFGALLIALTRYRLGRVPHEAVIGIIFVVASALGILVLDRSPHGAEELLNLMRGNILLVPMDEVTHTAGVYGAILVTILLMWKRIAAVTLEDPDQPQGLSRVFYDFAFYGLLAFVVASSVRIAGVLVVFTWLVMPPVVALFWIRGLATSALAAIPVALLGSLLGLAISYRYDWPTGAAIVVVFGVIVALAYLPRVFLRRVPGDA
jgi:zinc/manganese transport system permease protein